MGRQGRLRPAGNRAVDRAGNRAGNRAGDRAVDRLPAAGCRRPVARRGRPRLSGPARRGARNLER